MNPKAPNELIRTPGARRTIDALEVDAELGDDYDGQNAKLDRYAFNRIGEDKRHPELDRQ